MAQLCGHTPHVHPLFGAKNSVKQAQNDGHFWPFFDLESWAYLVVYKTHPQNPCAANPLDTIFDPLHPSHPILLSANPQPRPSVPRQCHCHQHQPSLPTTVANDRCKNGGNGHHTPNDRFPVPSHELHPNGAAERGGRVVRYSAVTTSTNC